MIDKSGLYNKICRKCKLEKSIEEFSIDNSTKDGHQKWCKLCWHNFHPQNRKIISITTFSYGWTKWGGANRGLVQEDLTEEWHCQACGETETAELPPYMYEFAPREFIRICSKCHNVRLQKGIEPLQFPVLVSLVRVNHELY